VRRSLVSIDGLVELLVVGNFIQVISSKDFLDLLMEGWWAKLRLSLMQIHVNSQAVERGHGGLVEQAEENVSRNESSHSDHDHRSRDRVDALHCFLVTACQEVEGAASETGHEQLTHEDKHVREGVGRPEFLYVLQVQQESVPSAGAVGVTRDGHVGVGCLVEVLDEVLEASGAAF